MPIEAGERSWWGIGHQCVKLSGQNNMRIKKPCPDPIRPNVMPLGAA
jgi:hypothetical protein